MTYRQRLTGTGYAGVALVICAPMALGAAIEASPDTPIVAVLFLAIATIVGLVMVLIGREYYVYTPDIEVDEEAENRAQEEAWERIESQY